MLQYLLMKMEKLQHIITMDAMSVKVTNNKQKGETMSKQGLAWSKLNDFISKNTGMHMQDLPDFDIHSWVEDDFTEKEIDSLIPDMAWDVLDNAGMDRKTVNILCYGEDCDE